MDVDLTRGDVFDFAPAAAALEEDDNSLVKQESIN